MSEKNDRSRLEKKEKEKGKTKEGHGCWMIIHEHPTNIRISLNSHETTSSPPTMMH
jgi:hypothetical protein